jgi:TetR/AcrR family transcriptional repressor of bet genes
LRGALSGDPFDTKAAVRLANDYIDLVLETRGRTFT